ncbi:hypothetical protein EXM22_01945 [Oceanispirochaeta crateris]|uniref:Peptidase C39-like domain-containing protein n=1 Tax=Oceanispirochaeta crateris TaxID=2518645 RepID=A0A5C1QKY9_9SPIO|nr:hypothetical protein [Oceanispirochaeta crateris]QEN06812.1 hypothetical protein EXM22_01945 [Oceanispirochaeta crateris]
MVVNYSRDIDYHTQRNNKLIPHSSCNSTSMIMALKQAGVRLPFPSYMQPEDYLTHFLNSKQAIAKMALLAPDLVDTETMQPLIPPHELHCLMEWAVNTLLGKEVVRFSTATSLKKIIAHIDNGGGAVLSGRFPHYINGHINHMVSLAGYMVHNKLISYLLIDDPYGDYMTGYRSHKGNNIPIAIEKAKTIFKPTKDSNEKWAYLVG